ncbi:ABC transporter substrate-binding protein [Iodobacter arcticus]|uniref:ABC transporter substrate-binding protein n=1 Tax=Iodobacter arcticus TaxID=590593 RepID=A0ABW2QS91_9NEIS
MKLKKMLIVGAALFAGVNAQAADTELEFWTMNLQKFSSYFEQSTAKFNEANPGMKAKWVDMNWDQIQPKLTASIAAGNPPALVNFNVPWVHEFAAQGLILPIDQYLGAAKAAYSTNAVKDVQVKGQMYAFPWYNSTQIIAYNKDIFAKAGIKAAPKTFAEFVAMGKQIKAKTGQAAFAPKMSDMVGFFYYAGLPVVTDGKAVFNSPKHIAFVQTFADLYKAGVMPKDVFKMAFEQEIAAYNSGKIAMMTTAAQSLKRTEADAKAIYDKTEVAPFPLDAGKLNLGSWMMDFVIPKGTKDPAAAAKLGVFLTNDEQQLAFSKTTESTMPSTKKANLDPYFQSGAKSADVVDRARAVAAKSMDNARTLTLTPGTLPDETVMIKKLQEEIQSAVEGRKSVKDALNTAAAAWNEKLKK